MVALRAKCQVVFYKRNSCSREREAESRVEKRNEKLRHEAACAQSDSSAHHHRHDQVGFHVEKAPKRLRTGVCADSLCVLVADLEKHRCEETKYDE